MTHTHTPGPWKACRSHETFAGPMWDIDDDERAEHEAKPFVAIEAERRTVMRAHDLFVMRSADARLIVAAPELLAALEDAEFLLRKAGLMAGPMRDSFNRSASDARAAIAKATGKGAA